MKLSCTAYAFNIRKRKQFREKDADLASFSLWGRKKRRRTKNQWRVLPFLRGSGDRGAAARGWGCRVVPESCCCWYCGVQLTGVPAPFLTLTAELFSHWQPFPTAASMAARWVLQGCADQCEEGHQLHVIQERAEWCWQQLWGLVHFYIVPSSCTYAEISAFIYFSN